MSKERTFWVCFERACGDKQYCTMDELSSHLLKKKWRQEQINQVVNWLLMSGKLYERYGQGKYSKLE